MNAGVPDSNSDGFDLMNIGVSGPASDGSDVMRKEESSEVVPFTPVGSPDEVVSDDDKGLLTDVCAAEERKDSDGEPDGMQIIASVNAHISAKAEENPIWFLDDDDEFTADEKELLKLLIERDPAIMQKRFLDSDSEDEDNRLFDDM